MQERVAQNLSRIEELRAEAAALEAGSPSLPLPRTPLGLELRAPSVQPAGKGRTAAVAAAARAARAQHVRSSESGQAARGSCWVPAALSSALAAQSIVAVEVEGVPWALFRGAQGQAAAVKDECAHRACPLSLVRAAWSFCCSLAAAARHCAALQLRRVCGCAGQGSQWPCAVSLPWCASPQGRMLVSACGCRMYPRRKLRWPELRPCAGWEYEAGGACVAMPSTAFVQGVSVDAPSVAEADGFVWIRPLGACQPLSQPPGLRGTCALPPDYEVVAEVQVGETYRAPCAADPCSALCDPCVPPTAPKHKARRVSGPALLDRAWGRWMLRPALGCWWTPCLRWTRAHRHQPR